MPNKRGFSQKQYKTIRKMIQSDKSYKEKQQDASVASLLNTGDLTEITSIAEGDDFNVRASDKCYLTKIEMQLEALEFIGDGSSSIAMRVIIARGRNGSLSTSDFPSTTGAVNIDKLQVYYDKQVLLNGVSGSVTGRRFSFNKSFSRGKIPHMVLRYDDAESAFSAQHNPVYLWMVTDQTTSDGPKVYGNVTANFYDSA